jgi:hypothetical protein
MRILKNYPSFDCGFHLFFVYWIPVSLPLTYCRAGRNNYVSFLLSIVFSDVLRPLLITIVNYFGRHFNLLSSASDLLPRPDFTLRENPPASVRLASCLEYICVDASFRTALSPRLPISFHRCLSFWAFQPVNSSLNLHLHFRIQLVFKFLKLFSLWNTRLSAWFLNNLLALLVFTLVLLLHHASSSQFLNRPSRRVVILSITFLVSSLYEHEYRCVNIKVTNLRNTSSGRIPSSGICRAFCYPAPRTLTLQYMYLDRGWLSNAVENVYFFVGMVVFASIIL